MNTEAIVTTTKPLKLVEIAARINAHLKRLRASPEHNPLVGGRRPFSDWANAAAAGAYVSVNYDGRLKGWSLVREDAVAHLAALDNGFAGKHYDCPTVQALEEARKAAEQAERFARWDADEKRRAERFAAEQARADRDARIRAARDAVIAAARAHVAADAPAHLFAPALYKAVRALDEAERS